MTCQQQQGQLQNTKSDSPSQRRNGPRCLFCNIITQEQARKDDVLRAEQKGKKSKKQYKTRGPTKNRPLRWMKCPKCQACVHDFCARKYLSRIEEVGLQDCDFANVCRDFLESSDPTFLLASDQSHCCMHKEFLKKAGLTEEKTPAASTASVANRKLPAEKSSATTPASEPPRKCMRLDGMLCFPTNRCLIAPDFGRVEVSSVAPSSTHPESGGPHFVTDAKKAMDLEERGVAPQTNNSIVLADFRCVEEITHPITGEKLQITARVQVVEHYPDVPWEAGTNISSDQQVEKSCVVLTPAAC